MNESSDGTSLLEARKAKGGPPVMYQAWKNLLFLHWKCDPKIIQEQLPEGLEVETYDGDAYLGIVPFFMCGVRGRCLPPIPGTANFLELNVRTYVRPERREGPPGVWFFSLDASCRPAVWAAKKFFHLPYYNAEMEAKLGPEGWIDYTCARKCGGENAVYRYRKSKGDAPREATPGTLEFFLLERYWLYAQDHRRNRLLYGRVSHKPYLFSNADVERFDSVPAEFLGESFYNLGKYDHKCCADDVEVTVLGLPKALQRSGV